MIHSFDYPNINYYFFSKILVPASLVTGRTNIKKVVQPFPVQLHLSLVNELNMGHNIKFQLFSALENIMMEKQGFPKSDLIFFFFFFFFLQKKATVQLW